MAAGSRELDSKWWVVGRQDRKLIMFDDAPNANGKLPRGIRNSTSQGMNGRRAKGAARASAKARANSNSNSKAKVTIPVPVPPSASTSAVVSVTARVGKVSGGVEGPGVGTGGRWASREEEWEALRLRLEPVIERMQGACVLLDAESRVAAWNRAAREHFGMGSEQVLGRSPGGVLVPEGAWKDFQSIYRQACSAGLSTSAVFEAVDGSANPNRPVYEWRMAGLLRPDGSVAGYTAMVGRRGVVVAEGQAAKREGLGEVAAEPAWEVVFDQTPVPTVLLTAEGEIWRANQAAVQLFQGAERRLEGARLGHLLCCSELGEGGCGGAARCGTCGLGAGLVAAALGGGRVSRREVNHRFRRDGVLQEARLLITASAVRHDGRTMVLVSLEDVTERRRNEGRLREQAMLLAAAEDAICIVDLEGRIVFWSPGAERLYGWSAAEAVDGLVTDLMFGGAGYVWAGLRAMVLEHGSWQGDLEPFSRRKRALSVRARAWATRDAEDRPTSIVVVATDLTGQRQLEKQLLRAQRMESVGTLACGIAHDLNNVLTPVQMAAELLRPAVAGTEAERFLNLLVRSAVRGVDITRQLLLFGRGTETGHASVDLRSLLKETVKILGGTLPKSIQVRGEVPDDLWPVKGDPTQLHQVVLNLCVNARDAMPEGGLLEVRAENHSMGAAEARGIEGGQPGAYVVLKVRDTGVGISPEVRQRMFDPFFTTKPHGMGTGLGLSTVQGIVRSHRGFVSVTTEVGHGSEFAVFLPAAEVKPKESSPATAQPSACPVRRGQNECILVVEDEESIRELIRASLERAGYHVLTAADGAEGVSVYGRHHTSISVVVLDMMLPLIDGATVIRMFRKLVPEMEFVAISGLPSQGANASKAAQRRVAFLPKPMRVEDLQRAVGAAVMRRKARLARGR